MKIDESKSFLFAWQIKSSWVFFFLEGGKLMYMWQFHASFSFANAPAVVGYVSDVFYRCLIWEIPLSKVTQKNTVFYDLRRRPYISEFSLFHGLWFLKILMGQAVTQFCMYGKHSSHLRLLCSSMIIYLLIKDEIDLTGRGWFVKGRFY